MASFPRLKTGAAGQYGCERLLDVPTQVRRFVDGTTQRFARQRARRLWRMKLKGLSAQEAEAIGAFIATHMETQERFTFTDPWDGVEYGGCVVSENGYGCLARAEHGSELEITIEQWQV